MTSRSRTTYTKAVILAGGLGTRLRPLTNIVPKPLLPIGESTILEVQILALKKHGVTDVFIATNYMHEYVAEKIGNGEKYGLNIIFSKETKRLGTCGPLSLLRKELNSPFFLLNGDILTAIDYSELRAFSRQKGADLTVVTKEINIPFRFGRVVAEGGYITDVEEKPNYKQEILAGIYAMAPGVFDFIPDDTYFGMDDLIKTMIQRQRKIAKYLMNEYWVDIGQLDDYEMAKEMFGGAEGKAQLTPHSADTE
jgi:NDP-mannose synthase